MALEQISISEPGIGTIKAEAKTTESAYASTNEWGDAIYIDLTPGKWVILGFLSRTTDESTVLIGRMLKGSTGITGVVRGTGAGGGGINICTITEAKSNTRYTVQGYKSNSVSSSSKFAANITAIKVAD